MSFKLEQATYDGIVNFIKDKVLTTLPDFNKHVFTTPIYFPSAQDFAARTEDTYNQKTYKIKYVMFSFANYRDAVKGDDENPDVFLTFNFQLFRQIQQFVTDQPNSHDLIVADMIKLMNSFNRDRDISGFPGKTIAHSSLVQSGDMAKAQESEYIVDVIGDWINYRLTVEVT